MIYLPIFFHAVSMALKPLWYLSPIDSCDLFAHIYEGCFNGTYTTWYFVLKRSGRYCITKMDTLTCINHK